MKMLKKFGKRSLATILAFMMCLGLLSTTAFAAEAAESVSLNYELSQDEIDLRETDQPQQVELTFTSTPNNSTHKIFYSNISVALSPDSPLKIVNISSGVSSKHKEITEEVDAEAGTAFWSTGGETDHYMSLSDNQLFSATIEVPADTPSGTYSVTFSKLKIQLEESTSEGYLTDNCWQTLTLKENKYSAKITVTGKTTPITVTYGDESVNLTTDDTVTINPDGAENFSLDGATESDGIYTLALMADVTLPTDLTRDGFIFTGWSYNSANKSFTAVWNEEESADYTVTLEEATQKTAVVPGEDITVNVVVSGGSFSAAVVPVTYEADKFTYTGDLSAQNGIVLVQASEGTDGKTIARLPFTAQNVDSDADVTFSATSGCRVTPIAVAGNNTAVTSTTTVEPLNLDWSSKYEVEFVGKEGGVIDTQDVGYNGYATAPAGEIEAPGHMEFDYWAVNGQKVDVAEYPITAATTFTAVFKYTEYTVTLGEGMDKSDGDTVTATYDQPLDVKIADYDAENNSYTVRVGDTVVGDLSIADDGTVTLPAGTITGDVTVSATAREAFNVTVSKYVTDHMLVLVKVGEEGTKTSRGFSYDGNQMYYVEAYKAYAWIVKGDLSEEDAADSVTIGNSTSEDITKTNDVNPDGTVDVGDVGVVYSCYKAANDATANNMKTYLCADINGDGKVDTDDIAALQNSDEYRAYLAGLLRNS